MDFGRPQLSLLLTTLIGVLAGPLQAGVVMEFETSEPNQAGAEAKAVQMSLADGYIKMSPSQDSEVVYSQAANNMTIITHSEKAYMVMDKDFASSIKTQMNAAMEQALEGVPPEQRAMMEQMMKQQLGKMSDAPSQEQPYDIRKSSRQETINGFDCTFYESYQSEQKKQEYCVSNWDALGSDEDIKGVVQAMAKFSHELAQEFRSMAPVEMSNGPFAEMSEIDGFPVLTRRFSRGKVVEETVLTSIKSQSIDSAVFQPPSGYTKRDMAGL